MDDEPEWVPPPETPKGRLPETQRYSKWFARFEKVKAAPGTWGRFGPYASYTTRSQVLRMVKRLDDAHKFEVVVKRDNGSPDFYVYIMFHPEWTEGDGVHDRKVGSDRKVRAESAFMQAVRVEKQKKRRAEAAKRRNARYKELSDGNPS